MRQFPGSTIGRMFIIATALAFLVFYVWFFWLRGFLRRAGSDDSYVDDAPGSFADRASERISNEIERLRFASADRYLVAINDRPAGKSVSPGRAVTFGKR